MRIKVCHTKNVAPVVGYNELKVDEGEAIRIGGTLQQSGREGIQGGLTYYASKSYSSGVEKPYLHIIVSVSPEDKISSRLARQIGDRVMEGMGLEKNPYVIYRHYDRDHDHIHIAASRVDFNGKLTRDSFYGIRMRILSRELEKEFELTVAEKRLISKEGIRFDQKWEKEKMANTGIQSTRSYAKQAVAETLPVIIGEKMSFNAWKDSLERRGVFVYARELRDGSYQLSYTVKPDLISKVKFESDSTFGRIGIHHEEIRAGSMIEENAEGGLKRNLVAVIGDGGRPYLVPENTRPASIEDKHASFKALELGPLFQLKEVSRRVEISEFDLASIAVKYKGAPRAEYYTRKPEYLERDNDFNQMLMAAEIRNPEKIKEYLKRKAIETVQLRSFLKPSDILYVDSILTQVERKNKEGEVFKDLKLEIFDPTGEVKSRIEDSLASITPPEAYKVPDLVEDIREQYRRQTGYKAVGLTEEGLTLILDKDYEGFKLLVQRIMSNEKPEKQNVIDPAIVYLDDFPMQLSKTMMELERWMRENEIAYTAEKASKERKEVEENTLALINAIKEMDHQLVKKIVLSKTIDLELVPFELRSFIIDEEARKFLRLDDNRYFKPNQELFKTKDQAEGTQKNIDKGIDSNP